MTPLLKVSSYQSLANAISELRSMTSEGRWEDAAAAMSLLADRVLELPAAHDSDREAIEGALSILARLSEQLRPLHEDPASLLSTLGAGTRPETEPG